MKTNFQQLALAASILCTMNSCVMKPITLLRGELETRPDFEIRKNFVVGKMKQVKRTHTNVSLLFGLIRPNFKDNKAIYFDCIDAEGVQTGFPIAGFYEPRAQFTGTKIPAIFTLGLVGLEFKKVNLTGQPYTAKSDDQLDKQ